MSDYAFVANGRAYTPNQTPVNAADAASHNARVEAAELAQWAMKPDRQLAYYDVVKNTVATWLGTPLGDIIEFSIYRHNFGGRFVSVKVQGNNGARYYGRASYDHGSCIVLRKVKS